MSTLHNFALGSDAVSAEFSPAFSTYSRVTIIINDDTEITTGDDTGRELTLTCPWGTEAMAENILSMLSGYLYQPYAARGALVDPAGEIGDAVTIRGMMGGIYAQELNFGPLMTSDVSAPEDKEIDHEYPYVSPTERTIRRVKLETEAEFAVQSREISAKVSKIDGDTSFGWSLTDEEWTLTSGNKTVLKADSDGIEISGKITALSGYIGNGVSGFWIGNEAIYNGVLSLKDTAHNGIYLGTDGIVLGKGVFKVDAQGNLTASSVTLTGEINATSGTIGSGDSVFTISGRAIKNGMSSLGDSNDGIYVGTDGIALGGGKFKVDAYGNLTANSGTFTGYVYASSIRSDGVNGYGGSFSGAGLSSGSVSKSKTGFQSTLTQVGTNQSDIASIKAMFANSLYANLVSANRITSTRVDISSNLYFHSNAVTWKSFTQDGTTYRYLGR